MILTFAIPHFWAAVWHTLYIDFWPPDASRIGPNLVASLVQWLFVGATVMFVYPKFRKWVERELDHLHAKMDHVIEHNPNVKNLPEHMKGRKWSKGDKNGNV